jgi:hypothetical protein
MRREPSLTLRGALETLGHYEPKLIGSLDNVLGGVILAAGAGAGIAAVGAPALAPLAAFAAVWGWVEQKNEAVRLLRQALSGVSRKLQGTAGTERRLLVAAAHTTIVAAAFFESFHEHADKATRKKLDLTDSRKKAVIHAFSGDEIGDLTKTTLDYLYAAEVPAPSPSRGYEENIPAILAWIISLTKRLSDLVGDEILRDYLWNPVLDGAVERYRSYYLALASKVPEFLVWAMLGEHAATRSQITGLGADLAAALDADRHALGRIEALLDLQSAAAAANQLDLCLVLERANQGVLDQPIIPADAELYGPKVVFPSVRESYINPRYRIARKEASLAPADENWWDGRPQGDDIDLLLAAHLMSPDATRLPLLLLGHPGAGKSLLTKVLAARTPGRGFTVVRVPLRQVEANVPIMEQIQQALNRATNNRIDWPHLVTQSADTVRVVLLDGLDELLQATSNDRGGYLHEVMEFQRIEADQHWPVVVIVTSRTVVADRVTIPEGTTIVKLDYFEEADVRLWLATWQAANAALTAAGSVRELTADAALAQGELARQPLLLMMLALYSADPKSPALGADLSAAALYDRLLDYFARREVAKRTGPKLTGAELDDAVRDQLDRLSVAALAMFNRGRLDVTEDELGTDLVALDRGAPQSPRPAVLGQRLIAEFFFVHTAEAHELAPAPGHDGDGAVAAVTRTEPPRRAYEFMHATFGEYLVARRVMDELLGAAEAAYGGRRGSRELDDHLLFALLSHQPFAVRDSIVTFATEIFAAVPTEERGHALQALEALIGSYHCRPGSARYATYRPQPMDGVRQLATYSANLVTLRVALGAPNTGDAEDAESPGVPLTRLFADAHEADALRRWRSTVALWRAGLDADGRQAMVTSLTLTGDLLRRGGLQVNVPPVASHELEDVRFAQLVGDRRLEDWLRFGIAVRGDGLYYRNDLSDWAEMMRSWLIPRVAGTGPSWIIDYVPDQIPDESATELARLAMDLIRLRNENVNLNALLIRDLFRLPQVFDLDGDALAAAVLRQPELVAKVAQLADPAVYGDAYGLLKGMGFDLAHPEPRPNSVLAWLRDKEVSVDLTEPGLLALIRELLRMWLGILSRNESRARPGSNSLTAPSD